MKDEANQSDNVDDSLRTRAACLAHARDLVAAATILAERGYPHLAFHLATLALEEIGKSCLVRLTKSALLSEDWRSRIARRLDDHVRKLFFAIWGPTFGKDTITAAQIEEHQQFAQRVHELRLRGLYVAASQANSPPPSAAISNEAAAVQLSLAESRLRLEEATSIHEPSEEGRQLLVWFLTATEDPEKRKLIFAGAAMDRLRQLQSISAWVTWLKAQFDEADRASRALVDAELTRNQATGSDADSDKWRVKVRFWSHSHSIRQREFEEWNRHCKHIQLFPAGKLRNEIVAELIIPQSVLLHDLWHAAFDAASRLLISLNLATAGFFWWHGPHCTDRFYESIFDIVNRAQTAVTRSPALRVEWGREILSKSLLRQVAFCMRCLNLATAAVPFRHYLKAVALMGKTDVFLQLEHEAFKHFLLALQEGMKLYGDWDGKSAFANTFDAFAHQFIEDADEADRFSRFVEDVREGRSADNAVALNDVAHIKVLTDAYYLRVFRAAKSGRADSVGRGGNS